MILYIIDRYLSFLILTANHFSPFIMINAINTLFSFIDTFLNSSFPWESGLSRSSVPQTSRRRPLYGADYRETDYRETDYRMRTCTPRPRVKAVQNSVVKKLQLFAGNGDVSVWWKHSQTGLYNKQSNISQHYRIPLNWSYFHFSPFENELKVW